MDNLRLIRSVVELWYDLFNNISIFFNSRNMYGVIFSKLYNKNFERVALFDTPRYIISGKLYTKGQIYDPSILICKSTISIKERKKEGNVESVCDGGWINIVVLIA